jgi:hypothetical protein
MGWRERDWARRDESERNLLYSPSSASPYGGGGRLSRSQTASRGLGLAVAVSLGLYAIGHFPRGRPLVPALAFHITSTQHQHAQMPTAAAQFGSTYIINGTTDHQAGPVEIEGSWNSGPWIPLATTTAAADTYSARFPITDHGTLKLRVNYPGGQADGTLLVP